MPSFNEWLVDTTTQSAMYFLLALPTTEASWASTQGDLSKMMMHHLIHHHSTNGLLMIYLMPAIPSQFIYISNYVYWAGYHGSTNGNCLSILPHNQQSLSCTSTYVAHNTFSHTSTYTVHNTFSHTLTYAMHNTHAFIAQTHSTYITSITTGMPITLKDDNLPPVH